MFTLTADSDPKITCRLILKHLSVWEEKLRQYFPSLSLNKCDWICNLFGVTNISEDTEHLRLRKAEELAELQAHPTLKLKFKIATKLQSWISANNKLSLLLEHILSTVF